MSKINPTQAFYRNLEQSIQNGFTGRNGILGEAMRDFENNTGFARLFYQLINKNYQNSQADRNSYRGSTNYINGVIMDALTENNKVIGDYPKTVGIIQRENILQESGKLYNFDLDGSNVTYRFYDKFEYGLNMEQKFIQRVKAKK